jgi:hypothetical protein
MGLQFGEFVLENIPDDFHRYAEVLVSDDIPQTGDLAPLDLRMAGEDPRNLFGGFSNDLKVVKNASTCTLC